MNAWKTLVVLLVLCAGMAMAQETVTKVEGGGGFNKHLTQNLMDRWILQGERGETVIAHVRSGEFDPVLELASGGGEDGKVLLAVDDQGSESRFCLRLPEKGEYAIRVHAFKFKGGGNYALSIRRFQATPVTIGKALVGAIDPQGAAYHFLEAKKGQVLSVDLTGQSPLGWELLDPKGRGMRGWAGAVAIEEDGVHSLVIPDVPGSRYEVVVREARQRPLDAGKKLTGTLKQGEVNVWNFDGKPGDFRLVTIEREGQLDARLIHTPIEQKDGEQVPSRTARPEIAFVPVASKGKHTRFAAILAREGRYQLQLAAQSDASYRLEMGDPTGPIEAGEDRTAALPVGASAFYGFRATPGQLLSASLDSDQFDPTLSLYNDRGDLIAQNDDGEGDGGIGSQITHVVVDKGFYRLQVASLGGGGGGQYKLAFRERKMKELEVGGRGVSTLEFGGTDFWTFQAKQDQTLLLSARSNACNPTVSLYSPDGVQLASDDDGGVGTDSLLAVRLPKTGKYTIWVTSQSGAGEYTLRLIDGD